MSVVAWALFVVSMSATIIAGVMLVLNHDRSKVQRYLGFFLVACAAWGTLSVLQSFVWSVDVSITLARATFIVALIMAYAMYRFINLLSYRNNPSLNAGLLASTIAIAILCMTPLVVEAVRLEAGTIALVRQPLYILVLLLLVAEFTISIATIINYYLSLQTSRVKSQTQLVMIGLIVGIAAGILTNIVLPNTIPSLHSTRIAWLPAAIWTLTLLYAVVRHQFLDIRMVILRSSGFVLSAVVAMALYYVTIFASSYWFGMLSDYSAEEIVLNSALIVVFALIFTPLKHFFDNATNVLFGRGNYSRSAVYAKLTDRMARVDTIESLIESVQQIVGEALQTKTIEISIIDKDHTDAKSSGKLTEHEQTLLVDEITRLGTEYLEFDPYDKASPLTGLAHKRHISLIFPLYGEQRIVGLFYVGPLPGRLYTPFDRGLLQTIADELSITVEKLSSIERVRGFNKELKCQIQKATRQLRDSNEKLIEMDATKDEFVSMASHQLRTPLTSVKGYISMVLEGDVGEISKEQRQLLGEAFTSSERMVHLIGDFLNVSRLQTGKFIIDTHLSDLAKVTEQEVEGMRQIASTHAIKLVYKRPARFPDLYLDENKMRQVIMNFIDNAVYYSPESKEIKIALSVEDGDAVLRVTDKGMGVPAEVQKKLFSKFFRAENARKQRPDGTGIGLYLSRKVIDGHGGSLVFESTEGKGSTFGFRLPIKKLSEPLPQQSPE